MSSRLPKVLIRLFLVLTLVIVGIATWFTYRIALPQPIEGTDLPHYERIQVGPDEYRIGNNWLRKNAFGLWEMYLEGAPFERGIIYGLLAEELIEEQEEVFIEQIRNMIPRESILKGLKYFIGWFNRDIDNYIPQENLEEIFGISQSFSEAYNYIGTPYYRVLNYHAAHDIGHALTDLNLVGCTSFAVTGEFSADSSLLIGRNFDFDMGDQFSKNKIILFLKPDEGYAFSSVTWAGFTGVVSGMNEKGLTVTLNAAKSDIPTKAKTPISILAREILQYAKNIDEAIAIAQNRETFVSESILIGSAADGKAIIIEKTPTKTAVFDSENALTVCSNHYQSTTLAAEATNLENIQNSDSWYRFNRMKQLISQKKPLNPEDGVSVLRDYHGMDDKFIGYGNPKLINQFIAHHGILFQPEHRRFWVSANPYNLGSFVEYDLDHVLSSGRISSDSPSSFSADPILITDTFRNFEEFRHYQRLITAHLMTGKPLELSETEVSRFISNNSESYLPYYLLGDYFFRRKEYTKAVNYYEEALKRELSSKKDEMQLNQKIAEARRHL